jgi:hypothetical protein
MVTIYHAVKYIQGQLSHFWIRGAIANAEGVSLLGGVRGHAPLGNFEI